MVLGSDLVVTAVDQGRKASISILDLITQLIITLLRYGPSWPSKVLIYSNKLRTFPLCLQLSKKYNG